jgi:hypothetical protein
VVLRLSRAGEITTARDVTAMHQKEDALHRADTCRSPRTVTGRDLPDADICRKLERELAPAKSGPSRPLQNSHFADIRDRFGRYLKYRSNRPIDSVIAEEALRAPAGPS